MINKKKISYLLGMILLTQILANTNVDAQNDRVLILLQIVPQIVESGHAEYPIGYIQIVDSGGVPVIATRDLEIELQSSDPDVATVPSKVTIPANHDYTKFNITVGDTDGETTITAIYDDQSINEKFRVGELQGILPDDTTLRINFPTTSMNVNSETPFAVFLETNGTILQAPKDMTVSFDYEKSLIMPSQENLVIKKGTYYTLANVKTLEKVGNAFLRAQVDDSHLNNVTSIKITSTTPASLEVHVYPDAIAYTEKKFDVFVSLLDSGGLPTVAPKDLQLEFFSNSTLMSDSIDKALGPLGAKIKRGQFGYYLRQEFTFQSVIGSAKAIELGASIAGIGVATDTLSLVEPLSSDDKKAKNTIIKIFTPSQIPSNATALMSYQINAVESDSDDITFQLQEELAEAQKEADEAAAEVEKAAEEADAIEEDPTSTATEINDAKEAETNAHLAAAAADSRVEELSNLLEQGIESLHPIDDLKEGELYPVQSTNVYSSEKLYENLKIISSDNQIVRVVDKGIITTTGSYGTAIIASGQKTGDVKLSAVLGGLGTGSNSTKVVNPLIPTKTKIFSPIGDDKIIFNSEGYSELYVMPLDSNDRPTVSEKSMKYLITPINDFLEVKPGENFAKLQLYSSSFASSIKTGMGSVVAVPIGEDAQSSLEATSKFKLLPSTAVVKVEIPFENISDVNNKNSIGTVQLTDFYGNPVVVSNDLGVELKSNNTNVVQVPQFVIIPKGSSFVQFQLTTTGKEGGSLIMASSRNIEKSETFLSVKSHPTNLRIYVDPIKQPMPLNQDVSVKIFVDNEKNTPVKDASVQLVPQSNSAVSPQNALTDDNGAATFLLKTSLGPKTSFTVKSSKEGYEASEKTIELDVSGAEQQTTGAIFGVPSWIIYVAVAGVLGGVGFAFRMFFKKPKVAPEETEEGI